MENIATVILERRGGFFSGWYRYTDEEDYVPLRMDGDSRIPWDPSALESVLRNLQIDGEGQPFRLLLTAVRRMDTPWCAVPAPDAAQWSMALLRGVPIDREGVKEWTLNQTPLSGEAWQGVFPVSAAGRRRYIYTFPVYQPPTLSAAGGGALRETGGAVEALRGYLADRDAPGKRGPVQPERYDILSTLRALLLAEKPPEERPSRPPVDAVRTLSELLRDP